MFLLPKLVVKIEINPSLIFWPNLILQL